VSKDFLLISVVCKARSIRILHVVYSLVYMLMCIS
jgi:hypothetical protein